MTTMTTIHAGPLWEVQLLQGKLDEEGIPSFIPDELTKRVDPFITGANALNVQLQVRQADVARAEPFILEYRTKTRGADEAPEAVVGGERGGDDEGLDEEARADLDAQTRRGRRLRWASLLVVTAPLGLLIGGAYLAAMRRGAPHPSGHGMNLAAIALSAALVGLGAAAILQSCAG